MSFMNWIIEGLSDISMWFYDLAVESWDAYYIPDIIGDLFYYLHDLFAYLAWDFVDFNEWLEWAGDEIDDILSWSNIRSLIRDWLPDIEDLVDWWDRWWVWVGEEIDDWWRSVRLTVQGWIEIATAGFNDLLSAWDNFWTTIYPNLVDFTWLATWWISTMGEVQGLIDTAFSLRDSLWAGWQEVRDQVLEFFSDPLEWLWTRFTDWFLGPEV